MQVDSEKNLKVFTSMQIQDSVMAAMREIADNYDDSIIRVFGYQVACKIMLKLGLGKSEDFYI